jgi:hypothetical protein
LSDQNSADYGYETYKLEDRAIDPQLRKQAEEAWRAHLIKDMAQLREERRRREEQTS